MHEETHYPVTEARNHMSLLIQRAVKGERIVIDLHGLPAVVLVPIASERAMMDAFLKARSGTEKSACRSAPPGTS